MTKFLITVDYSPGVIETPMTEWAPEDIKTHMAYYTQLNEELRASGELVEHLALTWPEEAKTVVSDGKAAPVVTDGPFVETKEMLAGFQMVDVDLLERALEIAALVSRSRPRRRPSPAADRRPPGDGRLRLRGTQPAGLTSWTDLPLLTLLPGTSGALHSR